jgi:Cupin domain
MRIIRAEDSDDGLRKRFYTGRSGISRTMRPANKRDGEHVHLMTQESTVVLAGEVEFLTDGRWERMNASSGAVFDIREPHDVRTREEAPVITWPGASVNIVAVTTTERIVPPSLDIFDDEIDLVVREDRFDPRILSDSINRTYWSRGLELDAAKSQHFWDILARNRKKLESLHRVLNI